MPNRTSLGSFSCVLACALLIGACASAGNVHRNVAKENWHEVQSKHFFLTTDLNASETKERIAELEQLWSAVADTLSLIVPGRAPPSKRIHMIHLAKCKDFRSITWEPDIGGYVTSSQDFKTQRTVVTCEGMAARTEILLHEFMHTFNYHLFSHLPAWLNEGLATYYQTIAVKDGQIVLGAFPQMDRSLWRHPKWIPSLKELMAFDYDEFQKGKGRRHYFASWKLVHLLNNSSPDYHKRFQDYLARLGAAVDKEQAWAQSFGDIPVERLSDEYETYQKRKRLQIFRSPYEVRDQAPAYSLRQLGVGEAHAIWVQLLMTKARASDNDAATLRDIRAQLDLAEADDPDWTGSLFWRAAFARHFDDSLENPEDPVVLLREYLERNPDDARAQLGLVVAQMDAIVPEEHTGLEDAPPGLENIEEDVRRLVTLAETPAELHAIGRYYALREQPMVGLNFARRALAKDTGCGACLDTLALMLFQLGRIDEAAATQQRAVNMLSESGVSDAIAARHEHYQKALRATRSGKHQ